MTIEDLSIVATDNENFSHNGNVVVKEPQSDGTFSYIEPKGAHYDETTERLIIEL